MTLPTKNFFFFFCLIHHFFLYKSYRCFPASKYFQAQIIPTLKQTIYISLKSNQNISLVCHNNETQVCIPKFLFFQLFQSTGYNPQQKTPRRDLTMNNPTTMIPSNMLSTESTSFLTNSPQAGFSSGHNPKHQSSTSNPTMLFMSVGSKALNNYMTGRIEACTLTRCMLSQLQHSVTPKLSDSNKAHWLLWHLLQTTTPAEMH